MSSKRARFLRNVVNYMNDGCRLAASASHVRRLFIIAPFAGAITAPLVVLRCARCSGDDDNRQGFQSQSTRLLSEDYKRSRTRPRSTIKAAGLIEIFYINNAPCRRKHESMNLRQALSVNIYKLRDKNTLAGGGQSE